MTSRSRKPKGNHPAIVFSRPRAQAWEEVATDEDFYRYLDGLRAVYAKRKYKPDSGILNENLLDEDYKKWKEKQPW